jgi:hypothetical protein
MTPFESARPGKFLDGLREIMTTPVTTTNGTW